MHTQHKQSGFTAVELLITLFVAAAFLIASYQLFNLVIKDGGATRSESRAANIAYDYLRKYAASSTTIPCTPSTPLANAPISVDGLTTPVISITVSCLPDAIASISKVEATVNYNNPVQTVKYAIYTSSTGSTGSTDITNGLVSWFKLNGDANNSVGATNGSITNATSTSNSASQSDMAYAFNGSNTSINAPSSFGIGTSNLTVSLWVYVPAASNTGAFIKIGNANGYGIGIGGNNTFDNAGVAGNKLTLLYENVRWIGTSANLSIGWHHVVMSVDGSGVPTAYLDGVSAGAYPGAGPIAPSASTSIGASLPNTTSRYFNGSIDDVRIYNRTLSLAEVLTLYSGGAK